MEKIAVNTSDVSTGKSTGEKVHPPLRCFLPLSGVNHGVGLIHLEEAQKKQWSLQIICVLTIYHCGCNIPIQGK